MYKLLSILFTFYCTWSFGQVHLQTGASQVNIPIFSYANADELSSNISINYINGNGIKVGDVGSSIGTGWSLQTGGVIEREQRGLPDDQKRDPSTPNPETAKTNMTSAEYYNKYFPNGYLFSTYSPSDIISNEGAFIKMYDYPGQNFLLGNPNGNIPIKESIAADREQDIFHLSYGTVVAEFVIGKSGQIKVLNDSRLKITMFQSNFLSSNIKTCIDYFVVTDIDGIQYIFSDKELSQTCTYNKVRFPDNNNIIDLQDNPPTQTGNWYYPNTTTPYLGVPVFLGQKTGSYIVNKWFLSKIFNPRTNKAVIFAYEQYDIDILGQPQIGCVVQANQPKKYSITINRESSKLLRLKKITFPTSQINFVYQTIPRIDVPNSMPLSEIQIFSNNGFLFKKFIFQYGYFYKSEIKPYTYQFAPNQIVYSRLCLQSLQEVGGDTQTKLPPYFFDYYMGGDPSNIYSDDIIPPNFSYFTDQWGFFNAHSLYNYPNQPNQIPVGSQLSNICINAFTVRAPVVAVAQNGIIRQITNPSGGTLTYEYEQNNACYYWQNITVGGVRVKRTIQYDGISHFNDIIKEYKYVETDGSTSSGWGYEPQEFSVLQNIRIYKEAGGKAGVTFKDVAYTFANSFLNTKGLSFSVKLSNSVGPCIQAAIAQIILQILVNIFTPSDPAYKDQSLERYSNVSNQSGNPLPYQYWRVEVIDKTTTVDNGKTVYEFTSEFDKTIDIVSFSFPFSAKDRYIPWAYGLPKRIAAYDNSTPAKLIKETINDYNFISSFMSDPNFMSKRWEPNRILYDAFNSTRPPFNIPGEYDITEAPIYFPQVGHSELLTTKERVYSKDGTKYSENQTAYTYNPLNFSPSTVTQTNSAGDISQKRFYYSEDYTASGFPQILKTANMVNTPISTETWVTKPGGQAQMISTSINEFGFVSNGDIKPVKSYFLQTNTPLTQAQIGAFNPAAVVRNSTFIKANQQINYNYSATGNNALTGIESIDLLGNRVNSVLYDYNNSYIVANIKNALQKDAAYTSFEADGTGGWTINSGNIITNQGAITGNNMFSGIVSKTFSTAGNYVVTLWVNGASTVTVNGNTGSLLNTINNWKLYSWTLNSVSSVTISGNNYDEVRLYPPTARMSTYTYEPLIGKTSECDLNNHITYYNYDKLGRLIYVRDEKNNILKKICYNVTGQVEDCSIGFKIYLSNNSGYSGVTFSIYIDGTLYSFPANGVLNVPATALLPGSHTFKLSCGSPTSNFAMSPNNVPIPVACNNNFALAVNSDITFSFYPVYNVPCSVSSASNPLSTSGYCSNGSGGTVNLYSSTQTIVPGSQLYYDAAKTQPVTNILWVRPWSGTGKISYAVNSSGVVQSTTYSQNCP